MDRREARKAYKMKVTPKGVFAVRCGPSGELWVGGSRHLDSEQNSLWFGLRVGSHRNKPLQDSWNTHGEAAFTFEVLETFEDDLSPLLLKDRFKERQKHWEQELKALAI